MKKLAAICVIAVCNLLGLYAQMPPGPPPGVGGMMQENGRSSSARTKTNDANASGIGSIKGSVVDASSSEPLRYAIVSIIDPNDTTIVTGALTDKNGQFYIKNIPVGRYIVRVKSIGYTSARNDSLKITPKFAFKDFGVIKLNPAPVTTGEVVVTGQRNFVQNEIDKKVVNVDETVLTISKSAKEVLEQVPSVSTDMDGNINLRGNSSVTILIDGRQSAMTNTSGSTALDMIPASSIDKIEIITNPSAKFDAEGMSGIINIILKKDKEFGFNGIANVSGSTKNNYNASVNTNAKYGDINLYANYGFRYDDFNMTGSTIRTSVGAGSDSVTKQNMLGENLFRFHNLNGGIDYYLDENNTIGASVKYFAPIMSMNQSNSYLFGGLGSERISNSNNKNNSLETSLYYDLNLGGAHKLSNTLSYSNNNGNSDDAYSGASFDLTRSDNQKERQFKHNSNRMILAQSDYSLPIGRKSTFEAGLKNSNRRLDNDLNYERYDANAGLWINDANISNRFIYNENIFAAYATYQSVVGDFGYKFGMRMEQTSSNSEQKMTGEKNERSYLDFFPNAYISYNASEAEQVTLSYSYRINRPNPDFLNPFADLSDPLNIRKGNPNLKPEYTHSVELGYSHNYSLLSLNASVYAKHTSDLINRIMKKDSSIASVITMENFNDRTDAGLELSSNLYLTKQWDLMISLNAFQSYYSGSIENSTISSNKFNWMSHFMTNINFTDLFRLQISGNYMGRMTTPQGSNRPMYGVDVALKRDFLDGKLSLALNAQDIFDSRKFQIDFTGVDYAGKPYTQEVTRKRDSRALSINLTYKFGSAFNDQNQMRRRKASDINQSEKFDLF